MGEVKWTLSLLHCEHKLTLNFMVVSHIQRCSSKLVKGTPPDPADLKTEPNELPKISSKISKFLTDSRKISS